MNWGGKERRTTVLPELRKLTNSLPTLISISERGENSWREYKVEKGYSVAYCLLDTPTISVCRNYFSPGTVFLPHVHENKVEYLICYEGRYKVTGRKTGDVVIEKGGSVKLEAGELHGGEALEQTWLLAITIPPDEGFPHGT